MGVDVLLFFSFLNKKYMHIKPGCTSNVRWNLGSPGGHSGSQSSPIHAFYLTFAL